MPRIVRVTRRLGAFVFDALPTRRAPRRAQRRILHRFVSAPLRTRGSHREAVSVHPKRSPFRTREESRPRRHLWTSDAAASDAGLVSVVLRARQGRAHLGCRWQRIHRLHVLLRSHRRRPSERIASKKPRANKPPKATASMRRPRDGSSSPSTSYRSRLSPIGRHSRKTAPTYAPGRPRSRGMRRAGRKSRWPRALIMARMRG